MSQPRVSNCSNIRHRPTQAQNSPVYILYFILGSDYILRYGMLIIVGVYYGGSQFKGMFIIGKFFITGVD